MRRGFANSPREMSRARLSPTGPPSPRVMRFCLIRVAYGIPRERGLHLVQHRRLEDLEATFPSLLRGVAGVMAEGVVYVLEVVEIEIERPCRVASSGLIEPAFEGRSVRQSSECVVVRLFADAVQERGVMQGRGRKRCQTLETKLELSRLG